MIIFAGIENCTALYLIFHIFQAHSDPKPLIWRDFNGDFRKATMGCLHTCRLGRLWPSLYLGEADGSAKLKDRDQRAVEICWMHMKHLYRSI